MAKYYLEKHGFGKSYFYKIKPCSESKAKKLKNLEIKIFDSKSEAEEYIKETK